MPRRVTLTDRQREALLHLPVDQGELLRHYTLSDEDLGHIRQRRRAHNRFGFALQLCVLRYPGRVLAPGELIPAQVSDFIAAQLGLTSDDLLLYAAREDGRLLGAEMAAPAAEHLAHLLALAITRGLTAHDMLRMPFYHPTLEEGLRTALRQIARQLPPAGGSDLADCQGLGVEALE